VYAITLEWPTTAVMQLGAVTATTQTQVTLLGYPKPIKYRQDAKGLLIGIPFIPINAMPCEWGWTFKLTNLKNQYNY